MFRVCKFSISVLVCGARYHSTRKDDCCECAARKHKAKGRSYTVGADGYEFAP